MISAEEILIPYSSCSFYEEFQKEIYDAPADEATVSYLLDRLSEAKELVIDEYNLEQSSKK